MFRHLRLAFLIVSLFLIDILFGCGQSNLNSQSGGQFLSIANLQENSVVETGFIVGTSASIASIGVSYDGASPIPATGTLSWRLALPTGISRWKWGSRHTIEVGSLNNGVLMSPTTSISVVQGLNHDVNGDGFPDLALSAPGAANKAGKVYVYLTAGSTGLPASASVVLSDPAATSGDEFGSAIALGDTNGDGYADLWIGSPGYSSGQGRVYGYLSAGTSGIVATPSIQVKDPLATAADAFGHALAVADTNGDGYDDLAVGSPSANTNAGRCYLFPSGSGTSFPALPSITWIDPSAATGDLYGGAVAFGDYDGDGYADLAVGSAGFSGGKGKVFFYQSKGSQGLPSSATSSLTETAAAANDNFGSALAWGVIRNNGLFDLVIGSPGYDGEGRVYIYNSLGSQPMSTIPSVTLSDPAQTAADLFGSNFAIGDINADGNADLIVASPGYKNSYGRVYGYLSQGTQSVVIQPSILLSNPNQGADAFGSGLILDDVNGDGYADLVIGASKFNSNEGRVYFYQSQSIAISESSTPLLLSDPSGVTGDLFGLIGE